MAFENCSFCGGQARHPAQVLASGSPPLGNAVGRLEHAFLPNAFPFEFNWSSESSISSPVESLTSPNETESEEDDDYIAGLAERIAHSMLDDDDTSDEKFDIVNRNWALQNDVWTSDATKVSVEISPPPLSLPGRGSLPTSNWNSNSSSSSNASSQVSSPPSTPLGSKQEAWNKLCAAAGGMLRLKINEESQAFSTCLRMGGGTHRLLPQTLLGFEQTQQQSWRESQTPLLHPVHFYPGRPTELPGRNNSLAGAVSGFCKVRNAATSLCYQHSFSSTPCEEDLQFSGCPVRPPKPDPKHGSAVSSFGRNSRSILKQQSSGGDTCGQRGRSWGSDALPSLFPLIQATGGPGTRAVFLGSSVSGRESNGTGVFLPRSVGSAMDTNKKPACSTVLLPTRTAQALNMNVEGACSSPIGQNSSVLLATNQREFTSLPSSQSSISTYLPRMPQKTDRDAWIDPDRKFMYLPLCSLQKEISLPTEWTY
eukprot:c22019_g1_i1 orf=912-2354(+)